MSHLKVGIVWEMHFIIKKQLGWCPLVREQRNEDHQNQVIVSQAKKYAIARAIKPSRLSATMTVSKRRLSLIFLLEHELKPAKTIVTTKCFDSITLGLGNLIFRFINDHSVRDIVFASDRWFRSRSAHCTVRDRPPEHQNGSLRGNQIDRARHGDSNSKPIRYLCRAESNKTDFDDDRTWFFFFAPLALPSRVLNANRNEQTATTSKIFKAEPFTVINVGGHISGDPFGMHNSLDVPRN